MHRSAHRSEPHGAVGPPADDRHRLTSRNGYPGRRWDAEATAVVMSTAGGRGPASPLKTVTLRLNRPLLFVLWDVKTGAILFMGRVIDPSSKG